MVICFLAFALYVLFIMWCLSDSFRFAVLSRIMLRRVKKHSRKDSLKYNLQK